jgi:Cdc6-like AAA superfamily ATPase
MGSWRMCFKPYSADEIKAIIEERLQGTSFFEPKAISFAVKKFSVYTSDLRKIFSVLKQVI